MDPGRFFRRKRGRLPMHSLLPRLANDLSHGELVPPRDRVPVLECAGMPSRFRARSCGMRRSRATRRISVPCFLRPTTTLRLAIKRNHLIRAEQTYEKFELSDPRSPISFVHFFNGHSRVWMCPGKEGTEMVIQEMKVGGKKGKCVTVKVANVRWWNFFLEFNFFTLIEFRKSYFENWKKLLQTFLWTPGKKFSTFQLKYCYIITLRNETFRITYPSRFLEIPRARTELIASKCRKKARLFFHVESSSDFQKFILKFTSVAKSELSNGIIILCAV